MKADALRKSILQLAVEGKLVPQEEKDSTIPLAEKKPKTPSFDIPKTWKWVELSSVATLLNGRAYSKEELLPQGDNRTPILRVGNLFTNSSWFYSDMDLPEQKYCTKGDLLFAWSASFGPKIWEGEKCIYHYHIWKIVCSKFVDKSWLYYLLLWMTEILKKTSGRGSTMVHITKRDTEKQILALPPVEEQRRIVQKLNELLPLVEVYGKEQEALLKLERELPGKLRASILQEAIQGKLVPQIDEEPSVEQIGVPPEDVPFAIPEKWKWVQLKNLVDVTKQKIPDKDFLYLDVSGVAPSKKSIQSLSAIKANDAPSRARKIVKEGMVLFSTVRPYFLKTVVAENLDLEKETIASTAFAIFSCKNELLNKFIWLVLQSPYFLEYVTSCQKGSTYPAITDKLFYSAYVPLPPVEEQRRIVQKVIELLGEVEKLS